jgi:sugar phosphate isomerase/epimerase
MNEPTPLSRRAFLKTTAGLALWAGVLGFEGPLAAAQKAQWQVGCRDVHLTLAGRDDCWAAMKELGAESSEVEVTPDLACPNLFHPSRKYSLGSNDAVRTLKDDLAASGCRITAFMMANRLDERLEEEIEWTARLVKAANQLGVGVIRIDVVPRKIKGDEFLPFAIKACKRMCEAAEGTPIRFGVENHGTTTNRPEFLDALFSGVGSSKLGLTLDCGNFYWYGHPLKDLYALYEKFAPRVVHTHIKSIKFPDDKKNVERKMGWEYAKYNCPIYEGDIDFKRVIGILRKAGYRGDLCIEDESLGKFPEPERGQILKKEIATLKGLV